MDVTVTGTPPVGPTPYLALPNGAWNIIKRVRHLNGTQVVQDFDDYNRIFSWWWLTQQDPIVADTIGQDLLGFGTMTQRQSYATGTTRYAFPIKLGFLESGYLPLSEWQDQFIEIYLDEPQAYLETNYTACVTTVNNIEWNIERIEGPGIAPIISMARQGKFCIAFDGWQLFQNTQLTMNNNLIISHRADIFKGVFTVFVQANDANNTQATYQRFWYFPKLDTADYQYKILGDLWPELAVDCRGDGLRNYTDYLKWVRAWKSSTVSDDWHAPDAPNIVLDTFNTENFMIVGDFTSNPESKALNNMSTKKTNQDIQLNVRFDSTPPGGYAAYHFINFSYIVCAPPKTKDSNWSVRF
jgi:hypothetical protein